MSNFWEVLKERGGPSHHQINDPTQGFDQDIIKTLPGSPSFNKKRKVSLLFDHLEPSELADHLSCLEFKCFCRISHLDYRNYTLQSSLREIPRLERSVALCNSISQWVQLMILNRPTPQQRAEVFTKFIQVTQKLRKHQNFNTLMAVIGGLCHSAISRLKETHSYLAQEILKTMSEMTELVSSSSNYSTYRRVYNECMGFKIPILGVQLKDLVSLNEALPDYLDNGKINVNKLHSLYQHILELLHLQKMVPPFKADKDVILLLKSSLDLFHTEDEIYSLSYAREPRSHKSLPSAGYKPSAGIEQWPHTAPLQPDPETLSNCVEQMVESVFQLCDPDQKGYISLDDFDKIVASLPFSFHILEKDHDGPVSRHEMTLFFRKACHMGTKLGVNFVQSLVETRLKNSLLSGNCIWAMAKQGIVYRTLEVDIMQSCSWKPVSCAEIHSNCRVNNNLCQKTTQTDKSSIEDSPALYPAAEGNSIPRTLCGDSCRSQSLLEELQVLEKERDNLLLENAGLHCSNSQLSTENARLQNQLFGLQEEIRTLSLDSKIQPSITRILDPMDSLHLQCDGKL
ncbi:hypothetical protein GDO86_015791 [Hymenochirus boettgeri]|uniref:RAS guanyl releasing protein 4 n=1 Tax=Hymenochirus boettgeri TaxID=247094 RepID=A0A8T2JZQ6_9PIPI|nr:hypothetical protein GDO86_015791 [Hymenochirus boettgeri]